MNRHIDMDEFHQKVTSYKEEDSQCSPIWIWFQKNDEVKKEARCLICKKIFQRKDGSTTAMITHLKRFHGFLSQYNAWKLFEELSNIKEERIKSSKRKQSDVTCEQPIKKQKTLFDCVTSSYKPQDPQQKRITNAGEFHDQGDNVKKEYY
jgi:hypothetical protein